MEITDVKVFPKLQDRQDEGKLRAYASITFDNSFVVRGLKVIEGKDGLFVAMPGQKVSEGIFRDIAHPLNNETRAVISQKVLGKFLEAGREWVMRAC